MPGVYLLPDGPKNLSVAFPSINWNNVAEYYVEALAGTTVIATTPNIIPSRCSKEDSVTLYFLNYLGAFDSVLFGKPVKVHEVTSNEFKKGLSHPLNKQDTGIVRFNISANDTYEARVSVGEEKMEWLKECLDSPVAFIDLDGFEGQADDYLPVVVNNGKTIILKNERDFSYDFVVQFKLSNEYILIRN